MAARPRLGTRLTFRADDHVDDAHVAELVELYANEWWSNARTEPDVQRMLTASDVVAAIVDDDDDKLVGFARALTDSVYLAVVLDVIVAPDYRGRTVGRMLIDHLLSRPELADVNSVELVCQPELQPFYEQWSFTANVGRSQLMRRTRDPLLHPAGS